MITMKRKLPTLVVAMVGGAAIAGGAPAAAAETTPTATDTVVWDVRASGQEESWSMEEDWGSTNGTTNFRTATGWLKDGNGEGCVQVGLTWYKDGEIRDFDESKKACGKGDTERIAAKAGDTKPFEADRLKVVIARV